MIKLNKISVKPLIAIFILAATLLSCTKEYDCIDLQLIPAFIQFAPSDIDTFVLRKYQAGNNYQNLVDTFLVTYGYTGHHYTSNDTTRVFISDGKNGIKAGYDWQLFIPAKNKTVFISDIVSEKKTDKRGYGIFSMDPAPGCTNDIFSVKMDGQLINFSNPTMTGYYLFIRN